MVVVNRFFALYFDRGWRRGSGWEFRFALFPRPELTRQGEIVRCFCLLECELWFEPLDWFVGHGAVIQSEKWTGRAAGLWRVKSRLYI